MNKSIIYILFLFYHSSSFSNTDTTRLKLIFAGDIMGHGAQIESAYNTESDNYNYDTCFYFIKNMLQDADIALANLEVTLAGKPYKGYPEFSSPDELPDAIKKAGFNVLVTANNHSMDGSKAGLERTIEVLDEKGIIRTGTFKDEEQRKRNYPLIIEKNNIRLAILNYTYGTNGIPVKAPNIVNLIDTALIAADLKKAASAEPDFIFVTIHWGEEYQRNENIVQRNLGQFIFENGADAIIGSHPHVVQPIKEIYPDSTDSSRVNLIAYSLGNLISNQRKIHTDGGILLEVVLEKSDKTKILQYSWEPVWVYKSENSGKIDFLLLPGNESENLKDFHNMNESDRKSYDTFLKETEDLLRNQ